MVRSFFAPVLPQGPRLSLSRWTPSYPLRVRLPPLGCRWNCRRCSTCCFHPQVCLDPRRSEKEVGSVRADVRSCRYGLDEAQLLWRFVIHNHLCVQCLHTFRPGRRQHRLRQGWPCQVSLQPSEHEEGVDSSLEKINSFLGPKRGGPVANMTTPPKKHAQYPFVDVSLDLLTTRFTSNLCDDSGE